MEVSEKNTQTMENEAEIVELAKTDNLAFEQLFNLYFPKIYSYLFKRVGEKETVEDLTSQTFL